MREIHITRGFDVQRSEVTKRAKDWALAFDACFKQMLPRPFPPSTSYRAKHQTTIMAEQIPNGDAPISADIEMKEESVAEVW